MEVMRMFPLEHPLIPFTLVSLRVFEPRYLQMLRECLDEQTPFGVVLIERGSEVGGDDLRSDIGTVAQIVETTELPDGQQAVVAVGVERIEVVEWLPDDPYPRAVVLRSEELPSASPIGRIETVDAQLRAVLALLSESGVDLGPLDYQLSDQPEVAAHQLCGMAPIGPFDAQRLVAASSTDERLDLLVGMLDEQKALLTARLGGSP